MMILTLQMFFWITKLLAVARNDYHKPYTIWSTKLCNNATSLGSINNMSENNMAKEKEESDLEELQRTYEIIPEADYLEYDEEPYMYYANLGDFYRELRNLEAAIICYKYSLELNERSASVWYDLGECYHDKDLLSEAIECNMVL